MAHLLFEAALLHPTAELEVAEDAKLGAESAKGSEHTTHSAVHPFAPDTIE
jgi:hypothetical protein